MIKIAGDDPKTGQPVLGIALTRENCERMLAGQPILFGTEGMVGLPAIQVFILAGEDEVAIGRAFMGAGLITEDQIEVDPGLADPHSRKPDPEVN